MRDQTVSVWRKTSHSDGHGACVEVAVLPKGTIAVRDSKNPDGPNLAPTLANWTGFLTGVKDGHFDL
jgi:predicted secreted Zn-dependent protease